MAGQAKNPVVQNVQWSTNVTEFKPSNPNPGMKVQAMEFKPTNFTAAPAFNPFAPKQAAAGGGEGTGNAGMNFSAPVFQPGVATPAPAPVKVEPPKPVEPPKEKHVLLFERITKGSETDVKSAELTEDDSKTVDSMKDIVSVI